MKSYQRNIYINYFFELVKYFNLMQSLWPMYLITRGFTLVEIGLLESIFHNVSLLMETPTGAFADVYGRKLSRLLGLVFHLVYFTISIFIQNFFMAAIGFVFAAIGYNLESGSGTALVYDSLKELGKEEQFIRVDTKREAIIRGASVAGVLLGGILSLQGYTLAYLVTIGLTLLAFLIGLFMKETTLHERKQRLPFIKAIKNQFSESVAVLKKDVLLAQTMIYFALVGTIIATSSFYMTTYWQSFNISSGEVGIRMALIGLGGAVSALFGYRLLSKQSPIRVFLVSIFLLVIATALMADLNLTLVGLMIAVIIDALLFVSMNAFFNQRIESHQRATLLSFSSMLYSIFMIFFFPFFGWLIESTSYSLAFSFLCGTLTLGFFAFYRFVFKKFLVKI